ncbi:phage shock protein PspD [Hafnia paralvei]|uniref:phage shock protein PspD n=1 Tax=Hafnia paralvei TaxID=546367 RepID=UPI003C2FCD38
MSQFKPADMLRAGGRQARRYLPGLLKNGLLLGLTFAPAGIAAGVLRYVTWRPLRWLLIWGLEPLLQRAVRQATSRYRHGPEKP